MPVRFTAWFMGIAWLCGLSGRGRAVAPRPQPVLSPCSVRWKAVGDWAGGFGRDKDLAGPLRTFVELMV